MRAKCPHCRDGCDRCGGIGYQEARFATGALYTRHCTNLECGFDNGGRIVGPDSPVDVEEPPEPCLHCGSFAEWLLIGEM